MPYLGHDDNYNPEEVKQRLSSTQRQSVNKPVSAQKASTLSPNTSIKQQNDSKVTVSSIDSKIATKRLGLIIPEALHAEFKSVINTNITAAVIQAMEMYIKEKTQ